MTNLTSWSAPSTKMVAATKMTRLTVLTKKRMTVDVLSFSFQGTDGNDEIFGGSNDDIIKGGKGLDALYGGDGDDWIYGGADTDWLFGDG